MPHLAWPRLAPPRLARPCRTMPGLARPRLVGLSHQPWTATPRERGANPGFDSKPRRAVPRHAEPCRAQPRLAEPCRALTRWPISSALDGQPQGTGAEAPVSIPCLAEPSPAKPRPAQPGPALPCPAMPSLAGLAYLVSPRRPLWRTGLHPSFGSLPRHALPGHAQRGPAKPGLAPPYPGQPRQAMLACLISPGRPTPGDGGRSPRFDYYTSGATRPPKPAHASLEV